jgi:hypothetical protein
LTGGKDYPEARFTAHHARIRFRGTFERNRFDHRTNLLEDAAASIALSESGSETIALVSAIIISAYPPSTLIPEMVRLDNL